MVKTHQDEFWVPIRVSDGVGTGNSGQEPKTRLDMFLAEFFCHSPIPIFPVRITVNKVAKPECLVALCLALLHPQLIDQKNFV